MDAQTIVALCVGAFVFLSLVAHVRVVPARRALVVERLGKYRRTLEAGFHVLLPYVDRIRYRHSLKEQAIDVPPQPCFTQDNVKITVDGVLYFRVIDPRRASYGILNYEYATIQLAQTTMRSVIGKLELDRTFEERDQINGAVVQVLDEASDPWGVKVTRYEIQNIQLPPTVQESMEYQIKADRQKRAVIARSVGEMEARINHSIGVMEEAINRSEGEKARQVNEAEGRAQEILAIAAATAAGLTKIAEAIRTEGGQEALVLRTAEEYIGALEKLAAKGPEVVLPVDLTDIRSITQTVRKALDLD
jgi:regulator of protease activity HflC (stomatin/prohibitin superfamily)